MTLNGCFMTNLVFVPAVFSDVVLEESPCPRGSSRTNFQVLVLVLVLGSSSLGNFRGLSMCVCVSTLCWGSYDVTSVWLVHWQLCISGRRRRLFETRCLQCYCPRGKSLSSRTNFQVLFLVLVLGHQVLVLVLEDWLLSLSFPVRGAWLLVLFLVLESQVLDNNTGCFISRIRLSSPPQKKTNEDRRTHSHNQRRITVWF